jgi:uncharacterized protein (TIGR03435 family)
MKLAAAILFCSALHAQKFEAASVKPNTSGSGHSTTDVDGNTLQMTNRTLRQIIMWAYDLSADQISGPPWLETEHFDIVAKTASGSPKPVMMQALLADRFKLAAHTETKEFQVYALVVAQNGPKMKKAAPGDDDMNSSSGHATAHSVTMDHLAAFLSRPRMGLGRPVVDKTGLAGVFDFTLSWTPEAIFTAIEEQLGLKLEPQKAPIEILIVDHAEKIPTEN